MALQICASSTWGYSASYYSCTQYSFYTINIQSSKKKPFLVCVVRWYNLDFASECLHPPFTWHFDEGLDSKICQLKSKTSEGQDHMNIIPPIFYILSKIFIIQLKLLLFPQWTASNLKSSHGSGLRISVLWTMITHAWLLIKTCLHASHFYALNEHNNYYLSGTRSEQVSFSPSQNND